MLNWSLICYYLVISFFFCFLDFVDRGEYSVKVVFFLLSIWLVAMIMISVDLSLKTKELLIIFLILLFFLLMAFLERVYLYFI